jgi:hypothetical protein
MVYVSGPPSCHRSQTITPPLPFGVTEHAEPKTAPAGSCDIEKSKPIGPVEFESVAEYVMATGFEFDVTWAVTEIGVVVETEFDDAVGPSPYALVATTVNERVVPASDGGTLKVTWFWAAVTTEGAIPDTDGVTVYEVIGMLPLLAGGAHDTVTFIGEPDKVAWTLRGADGGAPGVTGLDCALVPFPALFTGTTVNTYVVPFVRPGIVILVPLVWRWAGPGLAVTIYADTGPPPFDVGALHDMVACALPGTAVTFEGAPAAPTGTTAFDDADWRPLPWAFNAATVNV